MLILAGCKQAGPPGGAAGNKDSPEVGFVVIKQEKVISTTELTGRVAPQVVAEIRPQVGGIIKKRIFEEGSPVKAGDVLFQIDPAPSEPEQIISKLREVEILLALHPFSGQFERSMSRCKPRLTN